jgi:hypothetical protein
MLATVWAVRQLVRPLRNLPPFRLRNTLLLVNRKRECVLTYKLTRLLLFTDLRADVEKAEPSGYR